MPHQVILQTMTFDGEPEEFTPWHLLSNGEGDQTIFCTGEFVVDLEDQGRKIKTVERGGITCERCLSQIRLIKNIKL